MSTNIMPGITNRVTHKPLAYRGNNIMYNGIESMLRNRGALSGLSHSKELLARVVDLENTVSMLENMIGGTTS